MNTVEAQLTGKAKQLEEDHVKGMSEAERLREVGLHSDLARLPFSRHS